MRTRITNKDPSHESDRDKRCMMSRWRNMQQQQEHEAKTDVPSPSWSSSTYISNSIILSAKWDRDRHFIRMSSSVVTTFQARPNLRRRHREPASNHPIFTSFIVMALVSLTRGFVLKSGVQRCGHLHRVAPRAQFVLYSVARAQTNAQSSEDVSPSWENESQPDNHVLLKKPWKTLFDLELPEGQCIGVRIDAQNSSDELSNEAIASSNHWIHACLHPDEVKYAMSQPSEYTRETFLLGRLAMRQMLSQSGPILKDDHGRPNVPMLYLGSISHKRSIANGTTGVALLAPRVKDTGVGVDIELAFSNRRSIAKRVLTENEINELGRIEVSSNLLHSRCLPVHAYSNDSLY